jgi:hypothetical protein
MEMTAYLAASDCSLTAISEVMKGRKRDKSRKGGKQGDKWNRYENIKKEKKTVRKRKLFTETKNHKIRHKRRN